MLGDSDGFELGELKRFERRDVVGKLWAADWVSPHWPAPSDAAQVGVRKKWGIPEFGGP